MKWMIIRRKEIFQSPILQLKIMRLRKSSFLRMIIHFIHPHGPPNIMVFRLPRHLAIWVECDRLLVQERLGVLLSTESFPTGQSHSIEEGEGICEGSGKSLGS